MYLYKNHFILNIPSTRLESTSTRIVLLFRIVSSQHTLLRRWKKNRRTSADSKQWQNQSRFAIRPIDSQSQFFRDSEPEIVSTSIFDQGTVPFNCVKKDVHDRIEERNSFCYLETGQAVVRNS